MNEFLQTKPFDLYELSLFRLIAKHRSFTKAAELAGLTQSAVTRQIQGIESGLGISLLERTTRSVRLTDAGQFLLRESNRLLGDVDETLRRMKEEFVGARHEVRIGVSRTIALAHLPGLFHANLRRAGEVTQRVSGDSSRNILSAVEANELDVGVLSPPRRLPRTLGIAHRFSDVFVFIASAQRAMEFEKVSRSKSRRLQWMSQQPWLLIEESSNTGQGVRRWIARQGLKVDPAMELDSFDLIVSLVALGMGISLVPRRALAAHAQKKSLARLDWPERFERELVVVMRKHRKQPAHLVDFVKNILF